MNSKEVIIRVGTLGITTRTARTVCSRITGTRSVNPVNYKSTHPIMQTTILGKTLSLTILGFNRSTIRLRLSSKHIRIPRSGEENIRTMTGWTSRSKSSSLSFSLIERMILNTFAPPPPNSNDFNISGRILWWRKPDGYFCRDDSSCLYNS